MNRSAFVCGYVCVCVWVCIWGHVGDEWVLSWNDMFSLWLNANTCHLRMNFCFWSHNLWAYRARQQTRCVWLCSMYLYMHVYVSVCVFVRVWAQMCVLATFVFTLSLSLEVVSEFVWQHTVGFPPVVTSHLSGQHKGLQMKTHRQGERERQTSY